MNREQRRLLSQWKKERDKAVLSYDLNAFKKFYRKWMTRGIYDIPLPSDDKIIELAMRKMVLDMESATPEQKKEAADWLYAHGSKPIRWTSEG